MTHRRPFSVGTEIQEMKVSIPDWHSLTQGEKADEDFLTERPDIITERDLLTDGQNTPETEQKKR